MQRFILILFCLILFGCASYKGGTITDGNALQVGLKTSSTSTTIQALSWVNGLVVSWEDDVNVRITRTSIENISAFGVWDSSKTNYTEMVVVQNNTNDIVKVGK